MENQEKNDLRYTVYKHTTPSGKVYVGLTQQDPEQRWRHGKGYKANQPFFKAIQKYGWDNIKHEIIATGISHDDAQALERKFIKELKATDKKYGYNVCFGGEDGWVGVHHTEETKRKMSLARLGKPGHNKGYKMSDETKRKLSENHKGKYHGKPVVPKEITGYPRIRNGVRVVSYPRKYDENGKIIFSKEHRKRISNALKGIERSETVRKHMSEAQTKTKKPVRCIDTGEEFESMTAAMKKFNIDKTLISRACSGRNKTAKGLRFEYV